MKAVELKPGIYWVGAVDWSIRDFHGYVTPRGSTYNNYLIADEQTTLVDGVKYEFVEDSISNIKSLVEPGKIKNIVVNHIEPDHGGGLGRLMELAPGAAIYCTEKGRTGLMRFFRNPKWNFNVVKTGDTLKIGKRELLFIETPMIHWPDSMMTYIKEEKILISQDGFGQHLASTQRFDDEYVRCASHAELEDAMWDYYANILMPFGALIKNKIDEIKRLGLEIEMIAPDHGVIWRKEPGKAIEMYLDMAAGKADERVVIIYDSMWHNTESMLRPLTDGLTDEGMDTRVFKMRATPLSVSVKEFWRARGCIIGTPTLNNTVFPHIGEFLFYLKGLRPKNRILSAFGSFGWAGGAVKEVLEWFRNMGGMEVPDEGFQFNYRATAEEEKNCYEFGREFARKTREYHKKFV